MPKLPILSPRMRDVRIVNDVRLLKVIRQYQPISRTEICKLTGLNASTVTMIIKRLLALNMVSESSTGLSTGGRRPTFLTINPGKMFLLGIDMGAWQTVYTVSDFSGRQVLWRTLPTCPTLLDDGLRQPLAVSEDSLRQLAAGILETLTEAGLTKERGLAAAGVSVPELVDVRDGSMYLALEQGWVRVAVRQAFEEILGIPTFVENDTNAAALAEIWMGSIKPSGFENIVYVLVVEGIGTALIVQGRLHHGSHVGTGGFGHMPMDPSGPLCYCGARGCWESLASENALCRRFAELREEIGVSGGEGTQAAAIIAAAVRGNEAAVKALSTNARYLALGILGLVHGLSPQTIVVGGQITQAWEIVKPIIDETVRSRVYNPSIAPVEIIPSSLPYPPSLLGAVVVALSNMLELEIKDPATLWLTAVH